MRKEFKQDIKEISDKHDDEMERLEQKAEKRETELIGLISMFGDKYNIISDKLSEVIRKLDK